MTSSGSSDRDLPVLAEQSRHQMRLDRQRMTWWIPAIFVIGLGVAIFGLIASVAAFRDGGSWRLVLLFGAFAVFFGWVVVLWLIAPCLLRPRIVPYFTRELGPYGGNTMTAFARGRDLYRQIAGLEALAAIMRVKPLSAFGFAYDRYEQEVRWHTSAEGLRTTEALRQGLAAHGLEEPGLIEDLEALASVLRVATDRGVDFSLVLRLHAKDNMQAVCTREVRQGSFW